jgi:hypothetical protein
MSRSDPTFWFCSCCGVEFGYQDATPAGARRFRSERLQRGATWSAVQIRSFRDLIREAFLRAK